MKTTNDPPLFIRRLLQLPLCFSVRSNLFIIILKNFHGDAILPIVKLLWCDALDQCWKSETFLLWNEPAFLRAELPKLLSWFFCSVQLSNLILRNFYGAMQQYRYSNFSDVFCLNCIFVINAVVKELVSRSFLRYGVPAFCSNYGRAQIRQDFLKLKNKSHQLFTVG